MKYVKGLNEIAGENEDETSRLKEMAVFAISWLSSCSWCTDIVSIDFGFGVGDIIASFYFRITPINQEIDSELWVVVGDVPPAYLVKDKIVDGLQIPEQSFHRFRPEVSSIPAIGFHRSGARFPAFRR